MQPEPFIAYHPRFAHPLPDGHRFPMLKYELIPGQLLYEGTVGPGHFFSPDEASERDILRVHSADYWHRMKTMSLSAKEMRAIGFPLSAELVERERRIAQGTIHSAERALAGSVGLNVAGGTHHAFRDRGEGFCLLNDFAIAAGHLLDVHHVQRILIVDLDVHQGNGTAAIFRDEPRVFTFSMHGGHNYPFHKEKSDLDIPMTDGLDGPAYLALLNDHLPDLLARVQPEVVFYLAGVDVLDTDRYGKLQLSLDDCRKRDETVLQACRERRIGVAVAMGGGYSADVRRITEAHCATFRAAKEIYSLA